MSTTPEIPAALAAHPTYRAVRPLGAGGMGVVWLAERRDTGAIVAIKVISEGLEEDPTAKERFRREIDVIRRLDHPNVVHLLDAELHPDRCLLVMEYVPGPTLKDVLDEEGPQSVADACAWVRQAALGLACAHRQGVVHRDVKPHNLILQPDPDGGPGRVRVLDFGLARSHHEDGADPTLTVTGAWVGTPDYVAPEQARFPKTADGRADLYSLGCTLYHLLAGRPPHGGDSSMAKIAGHLSRPVEPLSASRGDVPRKLEAVLRKLLAKNRDRRYRTGDEVAAALAPFCGRTTERIALPRRRAALALLAAVAGMAVGGFAYRLSNSPGPPAVAPYQQWAADGASTELPDPAPSRPVVAPVDAGATRYFELGNGVKLEVVRINAKGKTFMIGSPPDEEGRRKVEDFDSEEQHEVRFAYDFYMGKYEVTQEQYQAVMGTNPGRFKGPRNPVEMLSWDDAQRFVQKLREKFPGVRFRLPSEAEWEYACRAGTTTRYAFGDTLTTSQAVFGIPTGGSRHAVGEFPPNAFGLYDMHGGVGEWCEDYFGPYSAAPKDGTPQTVKQGFDGRVIRGGYWYNGASGDKCRSAFRDILVKGPSYSCGLRVAVEADGASDRKVDRTASAFWQAHARRVYAIQFTPDGEGMISGGDDATLCHWEVSTRRLNYRWKRAGSVFSVQVLPGGVFFCGDRHVVGHRYDDPKAASDTLFSPNQTNARPISVSPDNKYLTAAERTRVLRWELTDPRRELPALEGHPANLLSLAYSPDGRYLAAGGYGGTVTVWDMEGEEPIRHKELKGGAADLVEALAWSRDGKRLLATFSQGGKWNLPGEARCWDMPEGSLAYTFDPARGNGMTRALVFTPDGKSLFAATFGGTITRWDMTVSPPKHLDTEPAHVSDAALWSLALSPDGQWLASGSERGTIRIRPVQKLK